MKKGGKRKKVWFEMRSCATTIMHMTVIEKKEVNCIHKPMGLQDAVERNEKKRIKKKGGRREESNLHA